VLLQVKKMWRDKYSTREPAQYLPASSIKRTAEPDKFNLIKAELNIISRAARRDNFTSFIKDDPISIKKPALD